VKLNITQYQLVGVRPERGCFGQHLMIKSVMTTGLVKLVAKVPYFLDAFQDGSSPTSTTSHLPDGTLAPRDVNFRQSCS
jgi:hypothetical protein